MSKLLTISIAAYNVEKTIEECLNSFLPCKHFDALEILVINDGSKDRTVEIVSEYVRKYPGVIYLVNKENGGHGSTLNKSLELATGKYYRAVDGDDWIDAVELDKLCDCLKKTDVDVVVDIYREVYPDHNKVVSSQKKHKLGEKYSFDELFRDNVTDDSLLVMANSTVKTQRLHDVGMKIQENCFYADTEMYFYIGLAVRTIMFTDTCVYQYRLGNTEQSVSNEGIYRHVEDLIKIEANLISLYHKIVTPDMSSARQKYLFSIIDTRYTMLFDWYTIIIQKSDKDELFVEFLRDAKNMYPEVVSKMHLSKINRYISGNPARRIPWIRHFRKTYIFKILKGIKHVIA